MKELDLPWHSRRVRTALNIPVVLTFPQASASMPCIPLPDNCVGGDHIYWCCCISYYLLSLWVRDSFQFTSNPLPVDRKFKKCKKLGKINDFFLPQLHISLPTSHISLISICRLPTSKLPWSISFCKRWHHQQWLQRWAIYNFSVLPWLCFDWTHSANMPAWYQPEVEPPISTMWG